MASPAVANQITSTQATGTTSHTVSLPTGIISGNLLLVFFACDGNASYTWPVDWVEIFDARQSGSQVGLGIAWKQADGGEGATITVTSSGSQMSSHVAYRITGHDTVQAPEVSVNANGTGINPDPGSLSPTGGAKDYLWLPGMAGDRNSRVTGWPAGYTNTQEDWINNANGACVGTCELQSNAASEDPGVFTQSRTEEWIAATVAVHPAGAAATGFGSLFSGHRNRLVIHP